MQPRPETEQGAGHDMLKERARWHVIRRNVCHLSSRLFPRIISVLFLNFRNAYYFMQRMHDTRRRQSKLHVRNIQNEKKREEIQETALCPLHKSARLRLPLTNSKAARFAGHWNSTCLADQEYCLLKADPLRVRLPSCPLCKALVLINCVQNLHKFEY